jgi:hypothetical protein
MTRIYSTEKEQRRHNSTYKKLAVQCLNEALCFVSSLVLADSFRLRNRQLLVGKTLQASLNRQLDNKPTETDDKNANPSQN